ncbi:M1 family metallopeptidase [Streptomyces sp. XD-27]|uniref:M1 family metallopeptidase n=1 Tax=Streptomyces sp. XD-27 TaxID=3062779 RepID=UPI0026F41BC3|nr:M1 family metallopeptidase [Streptomyces sp. XD-27]WKX72972.1 M1 family metallopeptidase [Streptomyces sp. XD-27]
MPHTSLRRRTVRRRAALVAAVLALAAAAEPPGPAGPQGIGDRLYPQLGNPGYDVAAYDIALQYHGNRRPLDAVTTVVAGATDTLDRFNLDFTHGAVRSVEVDGRPARYAQAGEDLVITPAVTVPEGQPFKVVVRHTSDPRGRGGGWIRTRDGLVMANQASAAHRVFPSNDHPSDKAHFTFHVTAPKDLTVVANGLPTGQTRDGARVRWDYAVAHPMATELAQVGIGRFAILRRPGPHGLTLRDVVPAGDRRRLTKWLAKGPEQIAWMERKVGPYPFETYGVLIADASTGFELETQTLSLFERGLFTAAGTPAWFVESIMMHELAHQWFGNSVSPRTWSDLWLNEGHATWYEALYAAERGKLALDKRMRYAYAHSDMWRAQGGPPAAPTAAVPGNPIGIFRPVVYDGSALVLYALRQEIGRAAFERLERAWVQRHQDGVAATDDFVRLASAVAGRDLTGFLRPWLYGKKTPPMPGHPDWKRAQPGKPVKGGPGAAGAHGARGARGAKSAVKPG